MSDVLAQLLELTIYHLRLSLTAIALGLGLSLPLGIWVARRDRMRSVVLGVAGVMQTIPGLALLAFMVPTIGLISSYLESIAGIKISAIGFGPALLALTIYSILPMLQNTAVAISQVNPALLEAAQGVGMTNRQKLFRVELPQAFPVIVAGVRTAAIWTVGTATLATVVGASSLGDYIFVGLQTRNYTRVALGCVASALLAIGLDNIIRILENAVKYRQRQTAYMVVALIACLWVGSVVIPQIQLNSTEKLARVGSKAFTEGYIVSEIVAAKLKVVGIEPKFINSLGSTVIFDAIRAGEIDCYLDFSGTIFANVMKQSTIPPDPKEVLKRVKEYLYREYKIVVAAELGYQNTYTFAMRKDKAAALNIKNLSDLAPLAPKLSMAAGYEFFGRPEWVTVKEAYGISVRQEVNMEQALVYQAVHQNEVDVISAYSTDGRIDSLNLFVIEDDKQVIPPYHAIILAREDFLKTYPEAASVLKSLEGRFNEVIMRKLNVLVDGKGLSAKQAAEQFISNSLK